MSEDDASTPADNSGTDGDDGTEHDERGDRSDRNDRGQEVPIATGNGDEDRTNEAENRESGKDTGTTDGADDTGALDGGVAIEVRTGPVESDSDAVSGGFDDGFALAGRVLDRLDESITALLSRTLDTEARLRVYVELRRQPWSTVGEIAEGADVYPRIVTEALEDLQERDVVERRARNGADDPLPAPADESEYEYAVTAPSALLTELLGGGTGVGSTIERDRYLGSEPSAEDAWPATADETGPVSIDIEDGADEGNDESDTNDADDADGTSDAGVEADGADGNGTRRDR